ncbi:hypothetical protein A6J40_04580 [Legionella longbeachae]|nr:hypothetical protein A6J40_04580 [Legionella longbeachae]
MLIINHIFIDKSLTCNEGTYSLNYQSRFIEFVMNHTIRLYAETPFYKAQTSLILPYITPPCKTREDDVMRIFNLIILTRKQALHLGMRYGVHKH